MAQLSTPTETLNVSKAKQQFSQVVNRVFRHEARVLVEKSGIPVAAVVSIDDLRRLERLDAERARDFGVLDEIGAAFADMTPEEIEREVGVAVARARAELRAEHQDAGDS